MKVLDSKPLANCQFCNGKNLQSLIFLGYVPPVNEMLKVDSTSDAEMRFPLEVLRCQDCNLVQIGYEVDPKILFPYSYPYLSGTTKILRENFQDLAQETAHHFDITSNDLIIDIGANDGTLLLPFQKAGYKVLGIEPSKTVEVAREQGIAMINDYFCLDVAKDVKNKYGVAKVITAANVFAHIKNVHEVVESILHLLAPEGIFISESHYLLDLVEKLQYDTIYHEHLRYYSLESLIYLFEQYELEVIRVKRIPTHGGSIRVYTARKGKYTVDESVQELLAEEKASGLTDGSIFASFQSRIFQSKLKLLQMIAQIKSQGKIIFGIGAPSRASTLINYVGLDNGFIDAVMEVSNSHKLNKFIPGTKVPVLDESQLYQQQPDYALLYSWHIANELMPILRKKGFKGKFIIPLPTPTVV